MKLLRHCFYALLLSGLTLVPVSLLATTEAQAKAGRELVKRYADTVVSVELVVTIKISMGDRAMPPGKIGLR